MSVGNPGTSTIEAYTPVNATMKKTGMTSDGRNADGTRVTIMMLRRAKWDETATKSPVVACSTGSVAELIDGSRAVASAVTGGRTRTR